MHRSQSFFILLDLALVLEQEGDDLFVPVFCGEMQGGVTISIIGIGIDFIFDQYLDDFQVSSKSCNMKSVSIVLGHCVDVGSMATEEVDNVVMSLVAGKVDGAPIVQTFPVDFNGITVFPLDNYILGLVVLPILAILPQLFIILVDIHPKVPPVELEISNVYLSKCLLCLPADNLRSSSSSCSSFSISSSSPVSKFLILNLIG